MLEVLVTPTFMKAAKRLHAKDKSVVDKVVKKIAAKPTTGEEKKGGPEAVVLLSLGSHENFYLELKRLS